jgi:hypothetical protein
MNQNPHNLTEEQLFKIKKAYSEINGRMHGTDDQNTICQSIGQKESLDFIVEMLGIKQLINSR